MDRQAVGRNAGQDFATSRVKWAAACLVIGCAALAGCESRVTASVTANVPSQYAHVYVTIEQVWLSASANAGPDDAGWLKYPLPKPQTLDLASLTNGALSAFASEVPAPPGTYNSLRLILSDTSATLTDSASAAGVDFNNEVDYLDSAGTQQRRPLAVANSAQGVGIPILLQVLTSSDAILGALAATANGSTGTTTGNGLGSTPNANGTSTFPTSTSPAPTTSPASATSATSVTSGGSTGTVTAKAVVVFNAARDLVPFTYSGQSGFVLNASLTASDDAKSGTISSQIDISPIAVETNTARAEIQVTAEMPSADSTRNVPVLSAPVRSDGTFVLYPLPTTDSSPTAYDLVVHGPRVQTVIIKAVPVSKGVPSTATTVSLGDLALSPATPYAVNIANTNPVTLGGARVGFYQTLSTTGELPYLIEERPIDPVSGLFSADLLLSSAALLIGTYSGGGISLATATPTEGAGAYRIAASAPVYHDGDLSGSITPPANAATTTVTFTGPTIGVPATATTSTITATVNVTTPGRYDKGIIVLTHDGAIVSVSSLDSILVSQQATGTATLSAIPGGSATQTFDPAVYYAEVWVWNSNDPSGTFSRQPSSTVVDLRTTGAGSASLTVD